MKVKGLGVACFLITGSNGLKIIMDPYEIDPRGNIKHAPINESADIVTVSHEHGDHNHTADVHGPPDIIRGVGKVASPLLIPAAVAAPIDRKSVV